MNRVFLDEIILKVQRKKKRVQNINPIKDWPMGLVSEEMGCDRGTPIDRKYIEMFLKKNRAYIKGSVMEIGDDFYTKKYGSKLEKTYILTADSDVAEKNERIIYGDLVTGQGCEDGLLDCFILTQTLPFIYDVENASKNIIKMLKPGGVALITVSGISMISAYDDSRWGHYWGFTENSLRKLFESSMQTSQMEIISMGNPKTASAFLYGMAAEDLNDTDFETNNNLTPVMIGAVVKK